MKTTFAPIATSCRHLVLAAALASGGVALADTIINPTEDVFVLSNSTFTENTAYNGVLDNTGDSLNGEYLGLGAAVSVNAGGRVRSYLYFSVPSAAASTASLSLYQSNPINAATLLKIWLEPTTFVAPFNDVPATTGGTGSTPLPAAGTYGPIDDNNEGTPTQIAAQYSLAANTVGWVTFTFSAAGLTAWNADLGQNVTLALHAKVGGTTAVDATMPVFEDMNLTLENNGVIAFPASGNYAPYIDMVVAVPEPGTFALLALGGLLMVFRRR